MNPVPETPDPTGWPSAAGAPEAAATEPAVGAEPEPLDGRASRWETHREARRSELITAVRKAVHRHGAGVSMDDIAAQTNTAKSVYYRYFGDKAGLQRAVGEFVINQMQQALEAAAESAHSPRESLQAMVSVYLAMTESSPAVYAFSTQTASGGSPNSLNHFFAAVTAMVARPIREQFGTGEAAERLADIWAAGAIGLVRGSVEWWLEHRTTQSVPDREALARQITEWLWSGATGADLPPNRY
ncbi:TetR family transcriptional regulator [Saxibacter everestensis]|uniref:TetR family transcriptional regulator n=1 Tax=Saxibacter everestensis TaxID=2909229 RepID=A0ABY8QXL7_9MICO|nr:TetR family transcriptional regulator [Brevibacteriaceae bacterium ZFBP1038]